MSGVFTALSGILTSGGSPPPWSPTVLSPDVWVEPPESGSAGDRISSHQDVRGGAYPTFTASGDARPYLGLNDVCYWLGQQGAQGMGTSSSPLHYPTGSFCIAARIRFSAFDTNSLTNFEVLIGPRNVGASNSNNEYVVFWNSFSQKFEFQVFAGGVETLMPADNYGTDFGGAIAPFYSWITVLVWRDASGGGSLNIEIDGVAETPLAFSSTLNSTSTAFMFGMTEDAAVTSHGHQGGFFVFPSAPDGPTRQDIRDYFDSKWPNSVSLTGSEAIAALAASSATLWTLNEATFTSSSDRYWKAAAQGAGAYTWCWIQDIWISLQGQEAQATAADLSGIITRFYAARNGTTSIPVAIEADGTAGTLIRSGDYYQPDGICSLILMHKLYYDKSSDLTLFNAQKAVLKTIFLSYPITDDLLYVNNWCPYGFEDGVETFGKVSLGSVQFYQTARAFSAMFTAAGDTSDATTLTTYADDMQAALQDTAGPLWDGTAGMFLAATDTSVQIDILASAYAVYTGAASSTQAGLISDYLHTNYSILVDVRGYVRQSPINWIDSYDDQFGRGTGNYCDGTWPVGLLWILTALQVNHPDTAVALATRIAGSMATGERYEYYGWTALGYQNQLVIAQGAHAWAQANSGLF